MGFEQLAVLKAQFKQDAKVDKATSRGTSSTEGDERHANPLTKLPRTSADAAERAVIILQRRFPRAFPPNSASKIPLKVGILKDALVQAAALGLSERDVRNGIKLWCRGQRYWTCLTEGSVRVDLTGAKAGIVSAAEAGYGVTQERTRLARRQDRIARSGHRQPR
ncbi:ProQ/FinO family protein [Caballeronia sp. LZ001]|uniref:ProQ/FinO family protein n=1 Tax=Caballeronia sp. LZ001 TaxID=3038553 RepID=UPI002855B1DD|nr:ProQ/FinO family protein [Caballeronia sp. LZ001]MDR5806402.1 ProQ/FinO family protein [Caballeronia sp. LZ001]